MSRVVLSDSRVAALKPGPRRRFVLDALCPGLLVQVTPQGHRSFMLRGRWPGARNRVRRLIAEVGTITLAEARDTARLWLKLLAEGRDPRIELNERKRRAEGEQLLTFDAVCASYFAHLRGRSAERSRKEIEKELLPRWGQRRIGDITKADVVAVIDDLRARARRTVGERSSGAHSRLIFNHCRMIFAHAALRFDLERLPTDRLRPRDLGLIARPRSRVLSDVEIAALWRATEVMQFPFGPFIRVLLMTGARRGEIAGARWDEIDLATRTWTIPAARAKSGNPHIIPLTPDLLELLAALPRYQSGDFIFSACWGRKPICGFSRYMRRLLREMGDPPPFCLHDLRRSFRSKLSELGITERVAEMAISHGPRGLIRIYDRFGFEAEIRSANEAWHRRLRSIVSPANVVALARTA